MEMFVQFIMGPLCSEYEKVYNEYNWDSSSQEARDKINTIMRKRMPLDRAVLNVVVDFLPDPIKAQEARFDVLCPSLRDQNSEIAEKIKTAIKNCDNSEEAPCTVFISKM